MSLVLMVSTGVTTGGRERRSSRGREERGGERKREKRGGFSIDD